MILCDVADSDSGSLEIAALCISSNTVWKVPGRFLHSISHARGEGTEGGGAEEEAPCCFKAGKEANRSTIL